MTEFKGLASLTLVALLWAINGVAEARFVSVDPIKADPKQGANFNRYWYGNNNPYKFTDPDGRIAYQVGNTIYIPVTFRGAGATKERIDAIVNEASKLQTEDGTKFVVVPVNRVMGGVNVMNISSGNANPNTTLGEGIVKGPGVIPDSGAHIDSRRSDVVGAALHDTLHFAHLPDRYTESPNSTMGNRGPSTPMKGFENSIMGTTSGTILRQVETNQFNDAYNGLHSAEEWKQLQQRITDGN